MNDENLHGDFAGFLFMQAKKENEVHKVYDTSKLYEQILQVMLEIIEHEDSVIDFTFGAEESINGTTPDQLKTFNRSRANKTLELLGYEPYFTIEENPIAEWFYRGAKSIKVHDFFAGITNQYRRSWKAEGFSRLSYMEETNAQPV